MATKPQWATKQRQNHMVKLFHKSGGFCVFGHPLCTIEAHNYLEYIETCIEDWKAEDRETRSMLLKLEQSTLHDGTYGRYGGRFDPVARDVYHQTRPVYHFMTFGVAAESKQRIAVIRLPSTFMRLYVQVSSAYQGVSVSKSKRRKMARHHAGPPAPVWQEIDRLCCEAVAAFWASRGK